MHLYQCWHCTLKSRQHTSSLRSNIQRCIEATILSNHRHRKDFINDGHISGIILSFRALSPLKANSTSTLFTQPHIPASKFSLSRADEVISIKWMLSAVSSEEKIHYFTKFPRDVQNTKARLTSRRALGTFTDELTRALVEENSRAFKRCRDDRDVRSTMIQGGVCFNGSSSFC